MLTDLKTTTIAEMATGPTPSCDSPYPETGSASASTPDQVNGGGKSVSISDEEIKQVAELFLLLEKWRKETPTEMYRTKGQLTEPEKNAKG